jgi:O-antigen ligase
MSGSGYTDTVEGGAALAPVKVVFLSVLMTSILAGALGPLSLIHRSATWAVWGCIIVLIFLARKELPLVRLLLPVLPYMLWLCFYLIWGLIVSPNTDLGFAAKLLVTTTILALSMAILTANPNHLRIFANCAQFAVVANLLLWLLIPWSAQISALILKIAGRTDPDFSGFSRYGGMLGNPNMLGYICIVTTILSVLAVPWIAWMGRLSCLPLLYLGASRKSTMLYLAIILIYVMVVQRRSFKFWVTAAVLALSSVLVLVLSDGLTAKSHSATDNPVISRIMDLQEKDTDQRGGMTRADLLQHWISTLRDEPWYGYGLRAMVGRVYDEEHPEKVLVKGPYSMGAHNTYLGVWVEVGPVGFFAFLLLLFHYSRRCLFNGGDPITKWVLISFLVVNLAFLFVSHSHLFSFEGMACFTLFFLLPSSSGLWGLGRSLTWKQDSLHSF